MFNDGGLHSGVVSAIISLFIMSITNSKSCTGNCGQCKVRNESGTHDHNMPTEQVPGGLEGWKLSGSAALVFLFPLLLAILGAMYFRGNVHKQFGGAVAGGIFGVLIAVLIVKLVFRKKK